MRHRKLAVPLALLLLTAWLVGCPGSHSNFASSRKSSSPAKLSAIPSSRESFATKHPPHDAAFSVYNNPAYGISFRYPRNYVLKEELDPDDSDLLQKEEELKARQPDAVLAAVVLIPDDAYPNTNFAGGHLLLAVNAHATAETCRSLVAPADSGEPGTTDQAVLQGIPFHWRDHGSLAAETESAGRDYVGFSNGICYEFFLEAASSSVAYSGIPVAQADFVRILRSLEKTVFSLQIHSVSALLNAK